MANTVGAAFEILRQSIEPPGYDRNTAAARKDHLISLLKKDFDVIDAFGTGSLPKYTAIRDHADLDIFVELDYAKHIKDRLPSQVLQSVRDCLGRDYTQARKNGQAVTLRYKTWPNVDVVPVRRVIDFRSASRYVYHLPNANNESWIVTDPVANDTELEQRNQSFGVEFKRIIKMIKWWNRLHGDYLQSYHIERIALDALTGGFSDFPWSVHRFFEQATTLVSSPMHDNFGRLDAYLGDVDRTQVIKGLTHARSVALMAWHAVYAASNHEQAIGLWQQIFGDRFPKYG